MPVIRFDEFGGIAPRVPPRALADSAAQTNHNLLASSREFRPLAADKELRAAPPGTRTLHRFARTPSGSLRAPEDTGSGWVMQPHLLSYVPGQLNDDATERTVVTRDDGTQPPRVVDAQGADRLLGVPYPAKPQVRVEVTPRFTSEQAHHWFATELMPQLKDFLGRSAWADVESPQIQRQGRWEGNQPRAGAFSAHGWTQDATYPWLMWYPVQPNTLGGKLPGYNVGNHWRVLVEAAPFWWEFSQASAVHTHLLGVQREGKSVFTAAMASKVTALMTEHMKVDKARALRQVIDAKVQELTALLRGHNTPPPAPAPSFPKPQKPTTPEWEKLSNGTERRAQPWVQYEANLFLWQQREEERLRAKTQAAEIDGSLVTRAEGLMEEIKAVSGQVTDLWWAQVGSVADAVFAMLSEALIRTDKADGLVEVEPPRRPDSRFYVTTFVDDWGQESAPSEVSELIEADDKDQVTVVLGPVPPERHIQKWRIYRSNTGMEATAFQFVEELLVQSPQFKDIVKGEQLGEVCPTVGWAEPPYRWDSRSPAAVKPPRGNDPYLRGVVGMPNGILAGFVDNFVAFCEPYHIYAWPVEYQITTATPIVGLGVFGQTLFVGTMAHPYLISGADSASMSAVKLDADQACVSRQSIVALGGGVVYASPDGLCFASAAGVQVLTHAFFSREEWQALQPAQIMAAGHEGAYYFWTPGACYVLDLAARKLGTVDLAGATAVMRDVLADKLYVVRGGQLVELFSQGRRTGVWRSRRVQLAAQAPLAWARVMGEQSPAQPATLEWFGDGVLRYTKVVTGVEPVRLPPGRYLEHEVRVTSQARITHVTLAGSSREIKAV